ncbi:hypothetical protein KKA93_00475 [Patescibacteria group bacterium]|nr:hypothetical protein [Patescibacteria group bacterium]MBU1663270.1 hypothetical protein [Patescibacteria group bacterium]MBU1933864.1 hypothetical protein [Patescibacteria group bacterium]MBU2007992.1 hypothetical protein [Patescibacteria group bacterium]MBU2233563.1 hypothetical protein [Patescibacteria group bacterium]
MLGYLQKFNNLPTDLRQKVSDEQAMAKIEALEKKYNFALAALIMKVMVREIALNDLSDYLFKENLAKEQSLELAKELKEKIFFSLGDYFAADSVKRVIPTMPTVDAPRISKPKIEGANFFFSSDDEEEIRKLTQKIVMAENFSMASPTIDEKLKEIISRVQINFGSSDLADRFLQILRTYLRGIRDTLETQAALVKPFLNGGLSFDEESAEKVMLLVDKILNSKPGEAIRPLPKTILPKLEKLDLPLRPEISRDAAYDFSKLAQKHDKTKNDFKKLDTGHELAPLTPAVIPAAVLQKNVPKIQEKILVAPKTQFKAKPIQPAAGRDSDVMPLIKRRFEAENLSQNQKVKIEDVKYVPRVMGPLDEIKYMDLINFRRLDKDPLKSADKIKSKINLLAEQGYGKKLEGIKFWRLSPINKLYLKIGNFSISENKPVDVIIEERKTAGSDYLTADEFKTIMDLNKSLRF